MDFHNFKNYDHLILAVLSSLLVRAFWYCPGNWF